MRFCICQREEDGEEYLACSHPLQMCSGWVHPKCVSITTSQKRLIGDIYQCPLCTQTEREACKLVLKAFIRNKRLMNIDIHQENKQSIKKSRFQIRSFYFYLTYYFYHFFIF